jgi:aminomethyltransferase
MEGKLLGELTSGGLSPSLGAGIGLAYLPTDRVKVNTPVQIGIRGKYLPAKVVKKPFYRK